MLVVVVEGKEMISIDKNSSPKESRCGPKPRRFPVRTPYRRSLKMSCRGEFNNLVHKTM